MKDKILEWMKEDIKNNEILTAQEFCQKHGTSRPTLYKHYKSINELRELAGGNSKRKKAQRFSDEELLNRIRRFYKTNKRAPNYKEITTATTITERFGSWNKAIELALNEERNFTKQRIKELYMELCKEQEKVLSSHEFYRVTRITDTIIEKNFGSWNNFREELGYEKIERAKVHSEEELKRLYIEISQKLDRKNGAYGKEFRKHSGLSEGTLNRFGGINELRKECGYEIRERYSPYTKEGIIKILTEAMKKKGRRLKHDEIEADKTLPSVMTCTRYFKTTKMNRVWEEIEGKR